MSHSIFSGKCGQKRLMMNIGYCKSVFFAWKFVKWQSFCPRLGKKFRKTCTKRIKRLTCLTVFGILICPTNFSIFALSGEIHFGVFVLPKWSFFVVLNSHLCTESFKPDSLKQSENFCISGTFSSKLFTPAAISSRNCVKTFAARQGSS